VFACFCNVLPFVFYNYAEENAGLPDSWHDGETGIAMLTPPDSDLQRTVIEGVYSEVAKNSTLTGLSVRVVERALPLGVTDQREAVSRAVDATNARYGLRVLRTSEAIHCWVSVRPRLGYPSFEVDLCDGVPFGQFPRSLVDLVHLARAESEIDSGNYESSAEVLREILQQTGLPRWPSLKTYVLFLAGSVNGLLRYSNPSSANESSINAFDEALREGRGAHPGILFLLNRAIGNFYRRKGRPLTDSEFLTAETHYERARQYAEKSDPAGWVRATVELGLLRMQFGQLDRAKSLMESAYERALQQDDDYLIAQVTGSLGACHIEIARSTGEQGAIWTATSILDATILARRWGGPAYSLVDWAHAKYNRATALLFLASLNKTHEEVVSLLNAAIGDLRDALRVYDRVQTPFEWARAKASLGEAYLRLGVRSPENATIAVQSMLEALSTFDQDASPRDYAKTAHLLGLTYRKRYSTDKVNDLRSSAEFLAVAITLYRELGADRDLVLAERDSEMTHWAMDDIATD
jgi:tetratricopeptide (TPR) repeat protein